MNNILIEDCLNCGKPVSRQKSSVLSSRKWGNKRLAFCDKICRRVYLKKDGSTWT